MLRPLTLVAVRQKQCKAAQTAPLCVTRADELVDDDLGAIREVAELAFPDRQRIRLGRRVAVLESEHRLFRQQRIDNPESVRSVDNMPQRRVFTIVDLVV